MTDEDEQLRNLYAGLAMLGYITQGNDFEYVVEDSVNMANALLAKVKASEVPCSGNRGLAAVKPRKRKD
jgi:hypothetical protein